MSSHIYMYLEKYDTKAVCKISLIGQLLLLTNLNLVYNNNTHCPYFICL